MIRPVTTAPYHSHDHKDDQSHLRLMVVGASHHPAEHPNLLCQLLSIPTLLFLKITISIIFSISLVLDNGQASQHQLWIH